ncbi:MAG: phage head closure protein [Lachnospiraceae bacterium]|nr:phage head closure protein [Lachnospiraceae bacterium]MBP3297934.1 phage head closure protein [Lachnospiraceae bacterium]
MRDEQITLITNTGTAYDESGFPVEDTEQHQTVFAKVKSVRASEYYEALRSNLKLAYIFCVDPDDFKLGDHKVDGKTVRAWAVEYETVRYKIIRTYRTDTGDLELSCEEVE